MTEPTAATLDALRDITGICEGTGADPAAIHITGYHHDGAPVVTVTFRSLADAEAFAAADKARLERTHNMTATSGEHYHHAAVYDRPGRRMLIEYRVFRHSPEWGQD